MSSLGMVVDLFAGGGGASTGIEWALQRPIDLAINHDAEALAMHRANHPGTRHLCCDIREVHPRWATGGKPVDVLWASPDCKHHSRAKGGKPLERAIRSLAWVVVRWAEETLPRLICVENVPEFQGWGPLGQDDRPIASQKGNTFRAWVRRLRRLGYRVEWRELVAADYGAPTSRKRLFVVARRDGLPISWPDPTHGPGRLLPWRTAAECIQWDDAAPSIFDRKKPLADKTQARIAKGIDRYVLKAGEPFVVTYYGEKKPGDFRGNSLGLPLRTQSTENRHALVAPTLIQTGYGEREGQAPRVLDLHKPLGTIVAGGVKHALVAPSLIGIDQQGARSANWPADAPLSTIVTKGKHGLISAVVETPQESAAWIAKHYGGVVGHPIEQPLGAVTAVDHHSLVSASVLKMRGTNVGSPADAPLHTISAQGQHHGLLCAHVERYYSQGGQLSAIDAPLPTATAKARFGLSTAHLTQFNGRSGAQPLEGPVPSVVSRDRFGLVEAALAEDGGYYAQVRDFLRQWGVIGPEAEAETDIHGVRCRIVDIGMRMLRPRELYRAQGFEDSYQIAPIHKGKPLTLTSQVRMCGNSVPPPFSAALVSSNMTDAGQVGRRVAEAV